MAETPWDLRRRALRDSIRHDTRVEDVYQALQTCLVKRGGVGGAPEPGNTALCLVCVMSLRVCSLLPAGG
jgi:hypothetical protein